ncbi:MAG: polysaccharide pyruvyl transferase CsaB [Elusimicrobiota bacterium]
MRILISGYYGFDNAGDELILECMVGNIRLNINNAEIAVLSANPEKTSSTYKVASVNRWNPFSILKSIARTDILISGGGGLFQDKTTSLSLYYYIGIIILAKLFRKKVFVYAVGISKMKFYNTPLLYCALKLVDFITVRNKESLETFGRHAAKLKNVEITTDPVFSRTLPARKIADSNPTVAMILRPSLKGEHPVELFAKLADSVSQLLSAKILFVPFQLPCDYSFSLKVMNLMRSDSRIVLWKEPKQLIDIFSDVDLVISQRLHGLILATLRGIPLIGVFNDSKLTGFMNEIGQKNMTNLSDDNLYSMLAIINDLWEWREEFHKNAIEMLPSFKRRSARNIELLREMLKNAP